MGRILLVRDFVGIYFLIGLVRQGSKFHLADRARNPASQLVFGYVNCFVTSWASDDRHA